MACCCGGSDYHPEIATDYLLVKVAVPSGSKPGQTIEVPHPDPSTGRVVQAKIPEDCVNPDSTFMVRFENSGPTNNSAHTGTPSTSNPAKSNAEAEKEVATIISPSDEQKIFVRVPMGARVGSMMYAAVPGDPNRVLPIRVPSRKIKKFYVDYTMNQTILRSDVPVPGGEGGKGQKQNWHDNRVAVMAPLFF